jgi:glucokinase
MGDQIDRLLHGLTFAHHGGSPRPQSERLGMSQAIGVDLGGSHVMAAVVNDGGEIVAKHERDITDRATEAVFSAIEKVVREALDDAKEKVVGIGIGSPGNIDPATGTVRYSPNFGWTNVPLGTRLRTSFDYPVFVGNDARCATLGEHTYGAGRGTQNFVLLTLGTGIGGGIIANGELLIGNNAGAGEIGHHQIRPHDGFVCGCTKIGCFEAQCSGTGLIRHAYAVAASFPRSTLLDVSRDKLGSKAIRKAAQAGDGHGLAAWRNWIDDLGYGLANIVAFVNPEMIALGGGVASGGSFIVDQVMPLVEARSTMVPPGSTRIVTAALGNDAGAIGAATMAMRGGLGPKPAAAFA